MKLFIIIILTAFLSEGVQAQTLEHKTIKNDEKVFGWEGMLLKKDKKIPVFLHYQKYDSLPGRYNKQLIVGKIIYPREQKAHKLIGYILNQQDASIKLYEFKPDGTIVQELFFGAGARKAAGYLIDLGKDEITGAFELTKSDSLIPSKEITPNVDHIFGTYYYNSEKKGALGHLTYEKNKDGTKAFKIFSKGNDGSGYVMAAGDSIEVTGTSFEYDAKAYDTSIWQVKIHFFREFAVVLFTKPSYEAGRFGERATIEGYFLKQIDSPELYHK